MQTRPARDGEEEEIPGSAELVGVVQPLRQLAGMGRVEDGQPVDDLGVVHRGSLGDGSAQSWPTSIADPAPRSWISPRMSAAKWSES